MQAIWDGQTDAFHHEKLYLKQYELEIDITKPRKFDEILTGQWICVAWKLDNMIAFEPGKIIAVKPMKRCMKVDVEYPRYEEQKVWPSTLKLTDWFGDTMKAPTKESQWQMAIKNNKE